MDVMENTIDAISPDVIEKEPFNWRVAYQNYLSDLKNDEDAYLEGFDEEVPLKEELLSLSIEALDSHLKDLTLQYNSLLWKDPTECKDPRISRGDAVLNAFVQKHHETLDENGICLFVVGSHSTGKTRNYDLDDFWVTKSWNKEVFDELLDHRQPFGSELYSHWYAIGGTDPHLSYMDLDSLEEDCKRIQDGNIDAIDIYSEPFELASVVYIGRVYYSPFGLAEEYKKKIEYLMEKYPFLKIEIAINLRESIENAHKQVS